MKLEIALPYRSCLPPLNPANLSESRELSPIWKLKRLLKLFRILWWFSDVRISLTRSHTGVFNNVTPHRKNLEILFKINSLSSGIVFGTIPQTALNKINGDLYHLKCFTHTEYQSYSFRSNDYTTS